MDEIKLIDDYLFKRLSPGESLVFDAKRILDPVLDDKLIWQENTHSIIKQYSRKRLKAEIETVHQQLFTEAKHHSFRQKIMSLFK